MNALDQLFAEIVRLRQAEVPFVLCTVVRTAGSTPRKSAARMLVRSDGSQLGTIGGGRVEHEVLEAARALLQKGDGAQPALVRYHLTHELAMCCGGEMEVFVEPLFPEPFLVICGGGHVGQALCGLARPLGFVPILVEDLESLGSRERFPDAERILDSFEVRDWQAVPLDGRTYVVIVTRDHRTDQALVEQLIDRDLAYLGLIGSKRKVMVFTQRLINKGYSAERLARLHAPIGLAIGAETPAEIAVSIAAELVAARAARRKSSSAAAVRTS